VPRLSLERITKHYGIIQAVDELSLEVADGALVALLGPSGCGKTTVLRLVAGFVAPDSGVIQSGERLLSSVTNVVPPEHRNMAMIFQSFALWPHMTVAQNVAYGLNLRRFPRAEIEHRTFAMLAAVRLEPQAGRYPDQLSGGQQQRVALARALVLEPQTLLLDEPLSNLDPSLRDELRFEIRRLHELFQTTTLYVTHDQTEAMTAADRLVVMDKGKIAQSGSPESVFERPRSAFVAQFLGGANILRGVARSPGLVDVGPLRLLVPVDTAINPGPITVAIRHHRITISDGAFPTPTPTNRLKAKVLRDVFLGSVRDLLVEIEGGMQLRMTVPPGICCQREEVISLEIAPAAIIPLPDEPRWTEM